MPEWRLEKIDLTTLTDVSKGRVAINVRRMFYFEEWVSAGQGITLNSMSNGAWSCLCLPIKEDVIDPEGDRPTVLSIPITVPTLDRVDWGSVVLMSSIIGGEGNSFRVPPPGYDPLVGSKVIRAYGKRHIMVNEDYYQPSPNPELYKKLVGSLIQITISPPGQDDDTEG